MRQQYNINGHHIRPLYTSSIHSISGAFVPTVLLAMDWMCLKVRYMQVEYSNVSYVSYF